MPLAAKRAKRRGATKKGWCGIMPLSMMNIGEKGKVVKVTGRDDTRQFLENLGFVQGSEVTVVSETSGNLIVNVKDTRVAIDKSMANRIVV